MKYIKRFSLILFAVVILVAAVPVQAFAVDPVSAAAISNAFAQAIAAYGASNGVALTFDVANTNGIGEGLHELWKNFREDNLDADDYDTLAAALFPHLYYKAASAVSGVATAYTVGVKITSEYAEEFDNFYNWLLSGPAEMEKVDNQYFEWQQAQIGPDSVPISIYYSYPFESLPIVASSDSAQVTYANGLSLGHYSRNSYTMFYSASSLTSDCFVFCYPTSDFYSIVFVSSSSTSRCYTATYNNSLNQYQKSVFTTDISDSSSGLYYHGGSTIGTADSREIVITGPVFDSLSAGLNALSSYISDPSADVQLGISSYGDSSTANFPDTADPNYDALNRAKDIPLNIPWDDTLYGDGTDALTDAQSDAIAGDVSLAIETDRIIELTEEAEAVEPAPDPSEVILPFIPVTLPHFDFSLSGIWYYVREWVSSLGAWLTTMFAVWNNLPWAMVVPVYASLVIVIVLGLYKRFFM